MAIDNIDQQILRVLFNNGRESLVDIKDKVVKSDMDTMSHTGIRKRITKLEKLGLLKVQGNLSIKNLRYQAAFILMEMKNFEEVQNLIEAYKECPRVFLFAHISGQYNLIFGVVGRSLEALHRYMNYCGPTNKKGVLHSAVIYVTNMVVPEYLPLNIFKCISNEEKCGNICAECAPYLNGKCNGCGNF
jgi:DNA-binding Lrp family transcriptional regulator